MSIKKLFGNLFGGNNPKAKVKLLLKELNNILPMTDEEKDHFLKLWDEGPWQLRALIETTDEKDLAARFLKRFEEYYEDASNASITIRPKNKGGGGLAEGLEPKTVAVDVQFSSTTHSFLSAFILKTDSKIYCIATPAFQL